MIFTNFDIEMTDEGVDGFYTGIRNDIEGIGQEIFDHSTLYGSDGRLQGTIDMGNLSEHSGDPVAPEFETTLSTLNHEILHRWVADVS